MLARLWNQVGIFAHNHKFSTCIGMKVKDGIVLACEKPILSPLTKPHVNRHIQTIDSHAGLVCAGIPADARQLANRAREEAASYRQNFETDIPPSVLTDRLSLYIQAHTLYSSMRPFGVHAIIGVGDKLFMLEPSGISSGFRACSAGKASQLARTELEKLDLDQTSVADAVVEAARILHLCHQEIKDREFELEVSWIPRASGQHSHVPIQFLQESEEKAKSALLAAMQYGD